MPYQNNGMVENQMLNSCVHNLHTSLAGCVVGSVFVPITLRLCSVFVANDLHLHETRTCTRCTSIAVTSSKRSLSDQVQGRQMLTIYM